MAFAMTLRLVRRLPIWRVSAMQRGLRRAVGPGVEGGRADAVDRADVDDPGRVLGGAGGLELGQQALGQEEHPLTLVSITCPQPTSGTPRWTPPRGAGVVHQHVEPLDVGHGLDQAVDAVERREVGGDRDARAAVGLGEAGGGGVAGRGLRELM